jgi:histidinol phosphatase-like enzyme
VARVHRRLRALLAAGGARLDAVLYCPHHPDGTVAGYARACRCRKPAPGMLCRPPPGGSAWTSGPRT